MATKTLPQFVLASASPARLGLLRAVGIEPIVQPSDFDEDLIQLDEPTALVQALASCKAQAVAARWRSQANRLASGSPSLILGCDSLLVVRGEAQGKPSSPEDAFARWQQMRGHYGDLITGHALIELKGEEEGEEEGDRPLVRCQSTRVHFALASDAEILAYIATGEPMNCAGCFTLEGRGGALIEKLEGCHSNVIGLSLPLLRQMLASLGYGLLV
jgi:septum formation protein